MSHIRITEKALGRIKDKFGKEILEVGCGEFNFKDYFEQKGFIWKGLDLLDIPGTTRGSMDSLPFENESFDVVIAVHSFEHCERPIDALREFRRVLRNGGWLFLSTPRYCRRNVMEIDPTHIFVLTPENYYALLIYCGFDFETCWYEKESVEHVGFFGIDTKELDIARDCLIMNAKVKK